MREDRPVRLFASLVPPTGAVEDLDGFLEPRRAAGRADGLRWSDPAQWHVTLAFAADVEDWRVDELEQRLAAAARRREPFTVRLAGGGALPDAARARVLHAGLDLGGDAATELHRAAAGARTAFAISGAEVDGARFRPHLTLARRGRAGDVTSWVRLLTTYRGPVFTVDRIVLVASHLGEGPRGRPRHEVLAELSLGAQPATP